MHKISFLKKKMISIKNDRKSVANLQNNIFENFENTQNDSNIFSVKNDLIRSIYSETINKI